MQCKEIYKGVYIPYRRYTPYGYQKGGGVLLNRASEATRIP